MKVGSKVVCIKTAPVRECAPPPLKGKDPVKGDILTIREMTFTRDTNEPILRFNEVVNVVSPTGKEYGYQVELFRELLPSEDLSEFTEYELIEELEVKELQPA